MTMLTELRALRARRRVAATITGVAAVAAVAVGVGLASPWRDDAIRVPAGTPSVPAPARPVGDELVVQRLDNGVITLTGLRAPLAHTPELVRDNTGFATFGFSADGERLAYTTVGGVRPGGGRAQGEVHLRDLTNGQDRLLGSCSFPCPMAVAQDGRVVVSLLGGSMVRLGSGDGSTALAEVPSGWELTSLDVGPSGLVVAAGRADGRASLLTMGADGSSPKVMLSLGASEEVSAARWSPDGSSVAFVHRSTTAQDTSTEAVYSVRSVAATGTGARSLADLGRCQCVGIEPALAWAPDGRLAVTTPFKDTQHLYTVGGAGLVAMDGDAVGGIAWRPGQ